MGVKPHGRNAALANSQNCVPFRGLRSVAIGLPIFVGHRCVELLGFFLVFVKMEAVMQRLAWTEQDNATMKSLAGQVSSGESARQLNRTEAATSFQAWKIGVSLKYRPGDVKQRPAKQKV